jgi:hypothetical protein
MLPFKYEIRVPLAPPGMDVRRGFVGPPRTAISNLTPESRNKERVVACVTDSPNGDVDRS